MEWLYLDESGSFEGPTPEAGCFVGGLLTTSPPAAVAGRLRALVDDLVRDGLIKVRTEPSGLHATDLRCALGGSKLELLRSRCVEALGGLDALRLASCRWVADAEISVAQASDARAFNRYLRMWGTLVRHAAWYPWWEAPPLQICTAQRSFPRAELSADDRLLADAYRPQQLGGRPGVRVAGEEQLPQMLRGLVGHLPRAPFARPIAGAQVGRSLDRATWRSVEAAPHLAGLLFADLVCDLIRSGAAPQRWEHLEIAYHPGWQEFEELARACTDAGDALEALLAVALGEAWLTGGPAVVERGRVYADRLIGGVLGAAGPRIQALAVEVASRDLGRREARSPRADRIFGPGGLSEPPLEAGHLREWVERTIWANHRGDVGGGRQEGVARRLVALMDLEVEAALEHLENVAHLAVAHQDDFDLEAAVALVEPWQQRAASVAGLFPGGRWAAFGRLTSNLAQSLAMRRADGDLERAVALMGVARRHLHGPLDLDQWACHAANLAALAGDALLLESAWVELFGSADPDAGIEHLIGHRFGPGERLTPLFRSTVVTRTARVGRGPVADALRGRLADPGLWLGLVDRITGADDGHPLERYLRHLAELAPAGEGAQAEALVERALGVLPGSRVAPLQGSCTCAAVALARLRLGDQARAQALGARVLPILLQRFEANPWAAPTVLCLEKGLEGGWLLGAVQGLQREITAETLGAFVERFRYEWR
ncbi:MAG TPA: hypothetical protein ENK18_16905 [Deltaproteobacteria bacterium]|nr:hypothetical protein [Deltaproteobacteria bacterium]